jgi:hypothetical protein
MGIKKLFNDIAVLLSVPIIYLNLFAGIIAFVWLIILGKWFLIVVSIVALFSHYLLGILMIPATLVQLLAFKAYEKKQVFLCVVGCYLGTLMNMFIFFCWVTYVYYFGLSNVTSKSELLPIMLWANGVAIGPIYYMANKEKDSPATVTLTFFTSLGCFFNTILISFFGFTLLSTSIIFLICMSICLNIMFFDAYDKIKSPSK